MSMIEVASSMGYELIANEEELRLAKIFIEGGPKPQPLPYGIVIERRGDGYEYVLPRTGPDEPKRRTRT
jgi:hypothetical protein